MPLLAGVEGVAEAVAREAAPPAFDAWVPLMDLPPLLGLDAGRAEGVVPYVHAAPAALPDTGDRLRVGLVWAGGGRHAEDAARSLALPALAPLAQVPGVALFGLQVGPARAGIRTAGLDGEIHDLGGGFRDFADTAAAVAALDLVIGVDTAVVHLAGAMARPVWTLLPFVPDWRWGMAGATTAWYPTMRLFRQPARGDWPAAVAAVAAALAERAGVS